jgi:hypothetical protein
VANYPSSSEVVRNLADLRAAFEVLDTDGKFRIVRIDPPYFAGSEFWIVNEKGFLWEAVASIEAAYEYLLGPEAQEYNETP